MANEVIKKEEYPLISDEDFDLIVKFDEMRKRYAVIADRYKESGHELLEQMGLLDKGYTQTKDGVTVRLYEKKPYKKKSVDTKALKEQGLYDSFAKDIWVKGSMVIQVDYEQD